MRAYVPSVARRSMSGQGWFSSVLLLSSLCLLQRQALVRGAPFDGIVEGLPPGFMFGTASAAYQVSSDPAEDVFKYRPHTPATGDVGVYVALQTTTTVGALALVSGRAFWGLCPMTDENTPPTAVGA